MDKSLIIIIIQILVVLTLVTIITLFIRLNESIKLDKRISKYSIRDYRVKNEKSFVDKYINKYFKFVKGQRRKISKLFPTLSRKYNKYVIDGDTRAVDYVTHKLIISVLFFILTVVATAVQGKLISVFQLMISVVIGFYALDIVLYVIYKFNTKKIENDILRAIIIMNNAFKSGKSTIQAVQIASEKLPKPINMEFKKIYQELKYGLSVDVVFDRFAKRVKIEEAEYLSSSLTILNKTGGNIIAVFDSIEKTLFDKQKLKEELKNSTLVSKLVVKILLIIPILFVLIIYILNPNYFDPFFESTLGYILLIIAIVMFALYASFLQKIVKVDY